MALFLIRRFTPATLYDLDQLEKKMHSQIKTYVDAVEAKIASLSEDFSKIVSGIGRINTDLSTLRSKLETAGALDADDQALLDKASNDLSQLLVIADGVAQSVAPPAAPAPSPAPAPEPTQAQDGGVLTSGPASGTIPDIPQAGQ